MHFGYRALGACRPNFVYSQFPRLKSVVDDWVAVRQGIEHDIARFLVPDILILIHDARMD